MPSQTLSLTIATQLQKAGFTEAAEQMRNLQAQIEGTTQKTSALGALTSKFIAGFTVAAAFKFYKDAADEAGKAEEAQARLQTSVESTGLSWDRNRAQVNAYSQALANASRFAKGDIDEALNILIQRTNSLSVSQANLQTVMGISVKTGRSLADVADQVGRAANGSIKDTQQLAKEFGITGENAKNADYVLNRLAETFAKAAEKEDSYVKVQAKLSNAWSDLKESFGKFFMPVTEGILDGLARMTKSFAKFVGAITNLGLAFSYVGTTKFKEFNAALKAAGDDFAASTAALWGKDVPEKIKQGGDKTTQAAHLLRDDLLQMVRDTEKETSHILANIGRTALEQTKANGDLEKQEVKKRSDFIILTATEQAKVLEAIDANTAAKSKAVAADAYKTKLDLAYTYGAAVGAAAGRLVAGEKEAWKDIVDIVIDALVQQITATIAARQAMAIAREVSEGGWYGLVTGAAQAAIIAGLGAAAKAALRGGGSVSTPSAPAQFSGGSGGGFSGSSPAAAAPAATSGNGPVTNVHIVVQGDMVNDPAMTDRLIRKISEAVENRNVRLVATQVA